MMSTPSDWATCRFTTKLIPCRVSAQRIEHCTMNLHMNCDSEVGSKQSKLLAVPLGILQCCRSMCFCQANGPPIDPDFQHGVKLLPQSVSHATLTVSFLSRLFWANPCFLGLESVTTLPRVAFKGAPKPLQARRPRSAHLCNKVNSAMFT